MSLVYLQKVCSSLVLPLGGSNVVRRQGAHKVQKKSEYGAGGEVVLFGGIPLAPESSRGSAPSNSLGISFSKCHRPSDGLLHGAAASAPRANGHSAAGSCHYRGGGVGLWWREPPRRQQRTGPPAVHQPFLSAAPPAQRNRLHSTHGACQPGPSGAGRPQQAEPLLGRSQAVLRRADGALPTGRVAAFPAGRPAAAPPTPAARRRPGSGEQLYPTNASLL